MGRKKKKQLKPWCWYCNREFDDEKILIQHQKSKHFKCTFCHKKLYTGPGLSIHSMQVHKEKIDKIPYALPHRCNVDLEIYGMEGIPDEDIKEHERQKSGKEDEVEEKRIKLDLNPVMQQFPMQHMPMPPGLPFMPPMSLPVMPPLQFGLAPPIFVARPTVAGLLPPPITRINHIPTPPIPPPQQPISSPVILNSNEQIKLSENNNIPPPPPPPPVNIDVVTPSGILQTPTFPAYSNSTENIKTILKVAKPTSSTPNIKVVLVHPEDDLPLEQIRLRLSKYVSFLNPINKNNPTNDLSWTKSNQISQSTVQIPPPPPPGHLYVQAHRNPQFDRPLPPRPWIAPHIVQFSGPLNFGGQGF